MRLLPSSCGRLPSGFVLLPAPARCRGRYRFPLAVESLKVINTLIFPLTWSLSVTPWAVDFTVSELIVVLSE